MTTPLRVTDITSYLADNGWQREPESWRGASIWSDRDGRDVLVPARDAMGDSALRVREILVALTEAEQRPMDQIAQDIAAPLADIQSYRTFPVGLPSGCTTVTAGLRALQGVHDLIDAAARVVLAGPHFNFPGSVPAEVVELLGETRLGPGLPGSYVLSVRVPADQELGRRTGQQLYDAVVAIGEAVEAGDDDAFDDTVTAGVSAELCLALDGLAGGQEQPFEVGFRWARGLPSDLPPTVVAFPEHAGARIRAGAERLRRSDDVGDVTVTGFVEGLHDGQGGSDRWRVQVRGEVVTAHGSRRRRAVWVRLADRATYDQAFAAQRSGVRVRFRGRLSNTDRRAELRVGPAGLELLD